jgi:hypothetical protein
VWLGLYVVVLSAGGSLEMAQRFFTLVEVDDKKPAQQFKAVRT